MGSKFREDKIGTLNESGGTITLPSGARLTIGGRQYTTESSLQVIPSGLSANTLYRIYAVISGGVVVLVYSINNNTLGPVGYNRWKLIGHFFGDRNSNVAAVSTATIYGYADLVKFRAELNMSASQNASSGANTKLNLNTSVSDNANLTDTTNFRIYVLKSGPYDIGSAINFGDIASDTGYRAVRITKNGSLLDVRQYGPATNVAGVIPELNNVYDLAAGDYIELEAGQGNDASSVISIGTLFTKLVVSYDGKTQIKDEDL